MVDMLNEIQDKAFLGQEFLAWLLLTSMKDGPAFNLPGIEPFEIHFDRQITLEGEDTGARKIAVTGSTLYIAPEVIASLRTGKLVSKAKLRFMWREATWDATINGATFDVSAVRVPVPNIPEVEEQFLMRLRELEAFMDFLMKVFHHFLSLRFDKKKWNATLSGFKEMESWESAAL
jgi:hypothetical protein